MNVIYSGFDNLDVAFTGRIPDELNTALAEAQEDAKKRMQDVLLEYRGVRMHVAETGAKGGYAYRCDTGPDGASWFFKRPNGRNPWGIRVSSKSLALALYGIDGVRTRMYDFMEAIGINTKLLKVSIGRVDYAIDVLAPAFVLEPGNFVMHARCSRTDDHEAEVQGVTGRVTGIRIGRMPGRQLAIYDKRKEVIDKHKVVWWEIWNSCCRDLSLLELDPKHRQSSQIWRIEFRAGKGHLKDRWQLRSWEDLSNKIGDVFQKAAEDIRLTEPMLDHNRSRWPNTSLWDLVTARLQRNLFEMSCGIEPGAAKEVTRKHHAELLQSQIIGLTASWATAKGYVPSDSRQIVEEMSETLRLHAVRNYDDFGRKMDRAADRYVFLEG